MFIRISNAVEVINKQTTFTFGNNYLGVTVIPALSKLLFQETAPSPDDTEESF